MSRRSSLTVSRKVSRHCGRLMRLSTQHLTRGLRLIAPTLIAMSLVGVAHAQGTMDFSGAQTLMGTFNMGASTIQSTIIFSNRAKIHPIGVGVFPIGLGVFRIGVQP
jgi:hypothetical protein